MVLQNLLLGFVVLIRARAGKQAIHAPILGSGHCYVLAFDLQRRQKCSGAMRRVFGSVALARHSGTCTT